MVKRLAWFLAVPLLASGLLSTSQPTAASSLPHSGISIRSLPLAVTLTPVADAYVHQSHPNANYGTAQVLVVDGNPTQRSYLRFNVQGLTTPVTKATLRIYATSSSKGGFQVHGVSNNSWGETAITYNNAPATGAAIQSSGSFANNAWVSVNVTALITGNGTFSLALTETSNSGISLGSRESSTPPQLIVESSAPPTATLVPPTATPVPPTATRVPPTSTPLPTATTAPPTRTPTPIPPTNTATSVPPTATPIPPTATAAMPTATSTATSITATATIAATATSVPTDTPTSVPATATPTATATFTPTNTPTPVSPTSTSVPPTATPTVPASKGPIRAAFFYPWFPEAWTQLGFYPYTNYHPSLGYYSSIDDAVIDQQLQLAGQAHLDAFISSWWGQGHHTDTAFQHILAQSERIGSPNPNLRWAIYYENESQGDPTSSQILGDLNYLAANAFSHPGYLRVNGKPVVFVYADANDNCGMADRWVQAKTAFGGGVYIVLKVFVGYGSCASQPDSWHQYAPAKNYDLQSPYAAVVSPGFWKVGETPRLARDPVRFESDVKQMATSGAFWQLVTTWNEWGEGTSIEPATEWNNQYVDILCRNLPGTVPCPGVATPTPTATSALPTATPIPSTATPVPPTATPVPPTATPVPPTATTVSPTATPTVSAGTITLNPVADSYADSANPSTNYGSSTQVRTDGSPIVNTYLRFDVQGLAAPVTRATLRIYANSALTSGYTVQSVADNTWGELTINYSNAPAIGATIGGSGAVSANTWTSVDVSSYITGNGAFSFALTDPSTTALSLASRESANKPELVISTGAGPSPTATSVAPTSTPTATSIGPTATPVSPTNTPAPTSTPGSGDPVVLATGDSRSGCNTGATATANLLSRYPASTLLLFDGDATDTGAYSEFTNCFDTTFGRYKSQLRPVPGNHEYNTSGASGYFTYYGTQAHSPGYYSFEIGTWHIVALNSEIDISSTSAQLAWLKNDLAANRTQCTLAYWHEPRWSSGNHGNNTFVSALWQTLYDNNVDLVFNGHDHDYERFAPQNPSGGADSARGIREFVIGVAGAPLYSFSTTQANSEVRMNDTYGLVQFTLHPASYDWQWVGATGSFSDSGSTACH